jgi:hypothetical protein
MKPDHHFMRTHEMVVETATTLTAQETGLAHASTKASPASCTNQGTKTMLHAREINDNFTIGPDGYAVPQADLLADFLIEHQDDPNEGPPERWPFWADFFTLELGLEPTFDPLPSDGLDDLTFPF